MQEKQPLQNFDNFLGAHKLNELLYLRLLSEMPSSVESRGFFFLPHRENKHLNGNGIMLSQENWLGISSQRDGKASGISCQNHHRMKVKGPEG